jgi:aspartate dehydrogenase
MKRSDRKVRVGILGCGAIGSRIAQNITGELYDFCRLTGIYDRVPAKAKTLGKSLSVADLNKTSVNDLLQDCDLMVEAVNANQTVPLVRRAILAGRDVLAMSVGKLLDAERLFAFASSRGRCILIPSGAIAGIDAIKSASLGSISRITLTTRKPLAGFLNNPYLKKQGIDLSHIKGTQLIFEGDVDSAVKQFPQNINVAATLALACRQKSKLLIRIETSAKFHRNSHHIEVEGDFGRISTTTENTVCPDNPKTSYLAVLSGIQTLKEYCEGQRIGT